jgi:hypothetical protein
MTERTVGRVPSGPSHRRALVVVVVLWLLVSVSPAAGQQASSGYGVRPAPDCHTDGRTGFAHALEPGASVIDGVEIFNLTGDPAFFDLYGGDVITSTGGGLAPAPRGSDTTGAGLWIVPDEGTVEVPPRSSMVVPFSISVPAGVAPGTEAAAVLVEPHAASGSGSIEARSRVALIVEIEVLGEVDLGVVLGGLTFRRDRTGIVFQLPVTNTGNVTFALSGAVRIGRSGDGAVILLTPSDVAIGPGERLELAGTWRSPPSIGRYDATPVVTAQVPNRQPVQVTGQPITIWFIPWPAISLLAIAALLAAWILAATRDRRQLWLQHRREERAVIRDLRSRRLDAK